MKEIEMKAWLHTKEERNRVRTFLQEKGIFLKKVQKEDIYFAKPNAETFDFRIREAEGKYFVTQKKRVLVGNIEQNEEMEFEVSNKEAFVHLTETLGYIVFLRKTKISEMYELPGKILAEVLEVPSLGHFLEVEMLCEKDSEIAAARENIEQIFEELSLQENIERRQYSVLIRGE